jgi:hypothetical protein
MHPFRVPANLCRTLLRGAVTAWRSVVYGLAAAIWFLGHFRVELWRVEGEEQNSRLPLSILCAVNDDDHERNYVLQLIFGDSYCQKRLGRFWLWNLGKTISAASNCSFIVLRLCDLHLKVARMGDWFLIPAWLLGEVDLPRNSQANHKVSGDLRRIRRHELQGEITHDPQQLDDFYHNMHVPYATARFGNCAGVASYERVRRQFQHSELLLIKNRDRSIAGQIILYLGKTAHLWDMGVRDGNHEYVKDGACCALSHFGLQYLENKGYKKASLGYSRPFLHDGTLQFKKKWSQRLVTADDEGFALKVLSRTPAAKAFLCHNPFIFRRRGKFFAAVFVDGDRPPSDEEIRAIDSDYFYAGLARLFIYCLEPAEGRPPNQLPPDLAERIELRCVADSTWKGG